MERSARLFHCARCHCQVIVCRRCDRGNVYCFNGCASAARNRSLRDAAVRYRRSHRGRLANAARQRRYRARRQKVTHQGSAKPVRERSVTRDISPESTRCHRCAGAVSVYLRQHFLQSGAQRQRPP